MRGFTRVLKIPHAQGQTMVKKMTLELREWTMISKSDPCMLEASQYLSKVQPPTALHRHFYQGNPCHSSSKRPIRVTEESDAMPSGHTVAHQSVRLSDGLKNYPRVLEASQCLGKVTLDSCSASHHSLASHFSWGSLGPCWVFIMIQILIF